MSNHWMKFYPRDWRGDQALRMVSLAARGLWMEMLCIMHEANPYGHLLIGGKPVEGDALSRMAGTSVEQTESLLDELQSAGVFSRSRRGVIYSRRMVSDNSRAEKGRKSVNKRWSQTPDNKQEKSRPNRSPNRIPITQKPEAFDKSKDGEPSKVQSIFGVGVSYLVSTGMKESNARSLLGKWRKQYGDGESLALIHHCQANSISEPAAFGANWKANAAPVNDYLASLKRRAKA